MMVFPEIRSRSGFALFPAFLVAAASLAACDEPPPEERLEAVGEALDTSSAQLADLKAQIRNTETLLEGLRDRRREVRDRVRTLEERLEIEATDVAIFRAVQSELLASDDLAETAIAVDVDEGAVTLRGTVDSTPELSLALDIARAVDGVASVASLLRVRTEQSTSK